MISAVGATKSEFGYISVKDGSVGSGLSIRPSGSMKLIGLFRQYP
jgi:hypothetical protein